MDCGGWCGGCRPASLLYLVHIETVEDNHWERLPKSCADYQKKGKRTDGEYLLYPPILNSVEVRIYCHNMNTTMPKEFVTLKYKNVGKHPNLEDVDCSGNPMPSKSWSWYTGETEFFKLGVNIQSMMVRETDFTFARHYGEHVVGFGEARDSYTKHYNQKRNKCGPVGTFHIDMRGTGLKVDDDLEWMAEGQFAYGEWTRDHGNATVDILAGGYAGGLKPIEPILLMHNPNDIY
ncbi:A disintegrin and metalloproteinase with thrombospondin motifs 9-like [Gigantopelta aegis]|uniref:A disintegrin and metalloproteinase with thrombospondin motifs 9-like n=1 Tax=Gigantopelta aegis TaxID=1735272 RepID=UPI001B888E85|nr:A disintegrin and metalloproteinase with thrombospondin motifs 9-like [Gigantopelta aegis]